MRRIIFFGTFNPLYSRNRTLLRCLERLGCSVTLVNERGRGIQKYLRLFFRLFRTREYDAVFVGFPGNLSVLLARCATRKPVFFDAFISLYDTYVYDRQRVRPRSAAAHWYWLLDFLALHLASHVVVDTPQHAVYFTATFHVNPAKVTFLYASTDIELFQPVVRSGKRNEYRVFWHGKYSPFHNAMCIVRAALILQDEPSYRFILLGKGEEYLSAYEFARSHNLNTIEFLDSVSYEVLPSQIQSADVCLGVFSTYDKVQRVVPNKVYEYLACGKVVITAESSACREILTHAEVHYIPPNDPRALAGAIRATRNQYGGAYNSLVNRTISTAIASRLLLDCRFLLL